MSDINYQKSKLMMLAPEPEIEIKQEEENNTLSIDPLADINLFSNNNNKKKEPIKEQPIKKKRDLTEDQKEKLKKSRLKGLETRRRNRELKKQEKLKQEQNKIDINQKYEVKQEQIEIPKKEEIKTPYKHIQQISNQVQLEQAKQVLHTPVYKQKLEVKQYSKPVSNPDEEFKKFYTMMSKYERIRNAQLNKRRAELLKKQKEEKLKLQKQQLENDKLIKQQTIKRNSYNFGFNSFNNRISKKPSSNNDNSYLHYFQ